MGKLKVGDRVICINDYMATMSLIKGEIYTVLKLDSKYNQIFIDDSSFSWSKGRFRKIDLRNLDSEWEI